MNKFLTYICLSVFILIPIINYAQSVPSIKPDSVYLAQVSEIINEQSNSIPEIGIHSVYQQLNVTFIEGPLLGKTVAIENDYIQLKIGDKLYINHAIDFEGNDAFSVKDIYRLSVLYSFILLFIIVVVIFCGKQGVRSLLSLAGSLLLIWYVLLPAIMAGLPPVLTSIFIASIILMMAIYATHGVNRTTSVALLGTIIAVVITGILAFLGVHFAYFTGIVSDESMYIAVNSKGMLYMNGILLSGILIGVLGILDDIAITQAAVVSELYKANPNLSKKQIYKRAFRVGKDHVGALINTLALAYTGASLSLLLLISQSGTPWYLIINSEMFASEIIRTASGSVGLLMTVPITTYIAVLFLRKNTDDTKNIHICDHSHIH